MNDDIDWDEIREEDRRMDRWDDDEEEDEEEPEERAPDWTIRDDNAAAINEWLRRR